MSFGSIQAMITSLKNNQRNRQLPFDNTNPKGIGEVKNTGFPERDTTLEEKQAWQNHFRKERQRKDMIMWFVGIIFLGILVGIVCYLA
ncbi:hypothetical protein [uncultured Microscilla sp.]|uniref:hypothetical protein n=1 Tax=uncultured Microscilla sp. TaxID=432653 RepID=UPI002613A8C8|nr:hypothetical protein [uncultured Microscilla sp.]